jgi:hypothetical protein
VNPDQDPTTVWAAPQLGCDTAEVRADHVPDDAGMVTVEYAIGTIAAAALATLLWTVARSPWVLHLIEQVFARALTLPR